MHIHALSIIVDDPPEAAQSVATQFGWSKGDADFPGFADVLAPGINLWFSQSAPTPSGSIDGLTIHVEVDDVDSAAQAVQSRGGKLVFGPVTQDFGMRTAVFQAPGNLYIDLCKEISV